MNTNSRNTPRSSAAAPHASRALLERRAQRLLTLLKLGAPDIMLTAELGLLLQSMRPQPVAVRA